MKIEDGKFYFIKQEFFEIFNEYNLMQNKENGNKRPCYFCFRDDIDKDIIWFVPISSKVEKYKRIYEYKRKKYNKVYNFVFGKLLGKEKVFLIQNMFPTTEKFIEGKYMSKNKDVKIPEGLKREIISNARNTIILSKHSTNIIYYDINKMKSVLLGGEYI